MRPDVDVLVIGSGFGGSVAALRAAEAGLRVAVLEQGRRIAPAEFEAGAQHTRKLLWEPALGLHGYLRQTMLSQVFVVGGVGVGGGSLVYAAVLLEPKPELFDRPGWSGYGVDWAQELAPHYARAGAMLHRQRNPDHGAQDDWIAGAADLLGVGHTYGATRQGIDFASCTRCGQCISGCPVGAKRSTDITYLAQAEELGARILPQSRAEVLMPLDHSGQPDQTQDGRFGWRVVFRDPLAPRSGPSSMTASNVVLAGGVLGTTGLLLANRDRWRTMTRLSPAVGQQVRTNSEAFAAILHPPGTDVTHGATISSDFYPDERTHVTNNRFPRSYSFMKWYLGPEATATDPAQRRRQALAAVLRSPRVATRNLFADNWHRRATVLTVMQHDDNEFTLRYRKRPWGWSVESQPATGKPPIPKFLPQAAAAGAAVAQVSGGTAYGTLLESVLGLGATAHILGGAVIGPNAATAVVDSDHKVFGYEGLRILDGSVVPTNIGVNPSYTITAMAERAMSRWLQP